MFPLTCPTIPRISAKPPAITSFTVVWTPTENSCKPCLFHLKKRLAVDALLGQARGAQSPWRYVLDGMYTSPSEVPKALVGCGGTILASISSSTLPGTM